jgi:hypothetical protein
VGDVVQGLHGGKYQFGDVGSSTLPSFEGQQFAETGYGSSSIESNHDETNLDNEPMANWAKRLVTLPLPDNSPELNLSSDKGLSTEIRIHNDERSWEVYYAFIVGPLSNSIVVEPRVGQLAPRGGVNQFSDSAVLTVLFQDRGVPASSVFAGGEQSWLVVGTEAARWFYRLQTTA